MPQLGSPNAPPALAEYFVVAIAPGTQKTTIEFLLYGRLPGSPPQSPEEIPRDETTVVVIDVATHARIAKAIRSLALRSPIIASHIQSHSMTHYV